MLASPDHGGTTAFRTDPTFDLLIARLRRLPEGNLLLTLTGPDLAKFPVRASGSASDRSCVLSIERMTNILAPETFPMALDPVTCSAHFLFFSALALPLKKKGLVKDFRPETLEIDVEDTLRRGQRMPGWTESLVPDSNVGLRLLVR